MNRWDSLIQQVTQLLQVRRLGSLVFARCVWQSPTPHAQLAPKLARLLDALCQWMQQPPECIRANRSADNRDTTLVVELRPFALAVITHIAVAPSDQTSAQSDAYMRGYVRPLGLDLFLLGTLGAVYLDGTQADWPHEPLLIPDLPPDHPLRNQVEHVLSGTQ
ncbi:MAG: hypothetical protein RMI91_03345 [Gemmatales bacterium]|nr:hypothetical protein [Gemmatales bacterium]MDW7993666.1 hypothetical protein [Gemmatales bacterium]